MFWSLLQWVCKINHLWIFCFESTSISTGRSGNFLIISPNSLEAIIILPSFKILHSTEVSIPISKSVPVSVKVLSFAYKSMPESIGSDVLDEIPFWTILIALESSLWSMFNCIWG